MRAMTSHLVFLVMQCALHVKWQLSGCEASWSRTRHKIVYWTMWTRWIKCISTLYINHGKKIIELCQWGDNTFIILKNCLGLGDMLLFHILIILLQLCERMPNLMGESAVDCGSVPSMPMVSFTIGDKKFELAPEEVSILKSYHWCCPGTPQPFFAPLSMNM